MSLAKGLRFCPVSSCDNDFELLITQECQGELAAENAISTKNDNPLWGAVVSQ